MEWCSNYLVFLFSSGIYGQATRSRIPLVHMCNNLIPIISGTFTATIQAWQCQIKLLLLLLFGCIRVLVLLFAPDMMAYWLTT